MAEYQSGTAPVPSAAWTLRDRLLFPLRWLRDTVNDWRLCQGNHEWTYDDGPEDGGRPYCEVCGMPGSWAS